MNNFQEAYAKYTAEEKRVDELYHLIAMQTGISDSVLWVMYCLADPETAHTQNDIAQKMGVPKQTVNSAVSRLLRDGYIHLEQMAVARNNKQLLLTEKGETFCKKYIVPVLNAEEQAFNRLSETEQAAYLSIGMKHNQFLQEELRSLLSARQGGGA